MFLQGANAPDRVVNVLIAVGIALGLAVLCGAWSHFSPVVGIQPIIATPSDDCRSRVAQLITDRNHHDPPAIRDDRRWLLARSAVLDHLASSSALAACSFVAPHWACCSGRSASTRASRLAGVRSSSHGPCHVCVLAGLAGLMITSNATAADPNGTGLFLEIDAILAVVIGGTSLAGGRFSLSGTLVGAFIIQTMTTMILTLGIAPEITLVYKAAIVTLVCLIQSREARAMVGRLVLRRQPDHSGAATSAQSVEADGVVTTAIVDASDLVSVASDVQGEV
jgi:simple sugar transport system permease protein